MTEEEIIKCEICGKEVYDYFICDGCNRNVCEDCCEFLPDKYDELCLCKECTPKLRRGGY